MLNLFDIRLWAVRKLMSSSSGDGTKENPYGHVNWYVMDGHNQPLGGGTRTSIDPREDCDTMMTALEFKSAVKRGVDITPEVLYRCVMGKEYEAPRIVPGDPWMN